ncbi:MAG: flagellar filament capping protein FliD [Solirubrobacteraceae bacterium]|nr:flagellar filament capping protein FliD [Solirubrobacteraceae bacterium]
MAGISLSGLASGLDTDSMVTQLLASESTGRTRLAQKQVQAEQRISTLSAIQTKLATLKTATAAMRSVANWIPTQTVESSDTSTATATRTGGAGAGSYTIDVKSLASSSQKSFTFNSPSADGTLTFGTTSVNINAGASIDDAVTAINQAGGDVIAVNAQGKLVVSSAKTGAASTFAASGDGLTLDSERIGKDATFTVDGGSLQSSPTNAVTGALPGVDLNLKKLGSAGITVGAPGPDTDALTTKVKAFVDAYNAVLDSARSAVNEQPVKGANNTIDLKKGTLFADQGLVRMVNSLRGGIGSDVPGLSGALKSLSDLGISTGASTGSATLSADAVAGKLSFDETKFKAALTSNPSKVREFLGATTGTNGFAQQFESILGPLTATGSGIADRIEQQNNSLSTLKKSLTKFDDRLATRETQLRKQFSAMESALAAAQARGSDLSAQLSRLG